MDRKKSGLTDERYQKQVERYQNQMPDPLGVIGFLYHNMDWGGRDNRNTAMKDAVDRQVEAFYGIMLG